jgi:hypothetical protein
MLTYTGLCTWIHTHMHPTCSPLGYPSSGLFTRIERCRQYQTGMTWSAQLWPQLDASAAGSCAVEEDTQLLAALDHAQEETAPDASWLLLPWRVQGPPNLMRLTLPPLLIPTTALLSA